MPAASVRLGSSGTPSSWSGSTAECARMRPGTLHSCASSGCSILEEAARRNGTSAALRRPRVSCQRPRRLRLLRPRPRVLHSSLRARSPRRHRQRPRLPRRLRRLRLRRRALHSSLRACSHRRHPRGRHLFRGSLLRDRAGVRDEAGLCALSRRRRLSTACSQTRCRRSERLSLERSGNWVKEPTGRCTPRSVEALSSRLRNFAETFAFAISTWKPPFWNSAGGIRTLWSAWTPSMETV